MGFRSGIGEHRRFRTRFRLLIYVKPILQSVLLAILVSVLVRGLPWVEATIKRLWNRAAQMYVAHILLFLIFTAQIARTARRFDNPMYENEFNVFNFLQHPAAGQLTTALGRKADGDQGRSRLPVLTLTV